jgi:hypothetical protein
VPNQPWLRRLAKADGDEIERLRDLAARMERDLSRAFLDAVEAMRERLDLKALAEMLEAGNTADALALIERELANAGFRPMGSALAQAAINAGVQAALAADLPGDIQFVFGPANPEAIEAIRLYELDKVREMNAAQLAAIRETLTNGIAAGRNPLEMARDFRGAIGLTAYQERVVANFRRQLEDRDPAALDRALRDKRFDRTVARAIRDDVALTQEQIDTMVAAYRRRWLKYRSETIGRTETIRALNLGNVQAWRAMIREGKVAADDVVKRWIYSHDSRTRDAHRMIPGMNPRDVPLEKPFDSILGPIRWPGDENAPAENVINCRCTLMIRYKPRNPA